MFSENKRANMKKRSIILILLFTMIVISIAIADHTPDPTSVTIAGSLQSELGCPGDWQPDCASTYLAYDAEDDVWQATFLVPAGSWEYKAALNNSWDENYGANATRDGANIPLSLGTATDVKFYYDHKTHWITDDVNSTIATVAGSFQSQLGCSGDWQPWCLRTWMQDCDGDGIYEFSTDAISAGSYEFKVALDEAWDISYPGSNVPFTNNTGDIITFFYDASTNDVTVSVTPPEPAIDIRKQMEGPDSRIFSPDSDVPFEIVVTNTGDEDLENVEVTDILVPDCDRDIGDLASSESVTYTCTALDVTISIVNEACVTGERNGVVVEDCDPSTVEIEGGGQGCTPGYWKQDQHFDSWTSPFTPDRLFSDVFEDAFAGKTLLDVLKQGGGGLKALGRHTVAALLNAASPEVSYDITVQDVIDGFNEVFPGGDYEILKDYFEGFNEQGCLPCAQSSEICECDLNSDGACDEQDSQIFNEDWGRTDCDYPGAPPCECDLNSDGTCNILDLAIFNVDWGRTDCPICP